MYQRWHRLNKKKAIFFTIATLFFVKIITDSFTNSRDLRVINQMIENSIKEALKYEKGSGCVIPQLNPLAQEVTQFDVPTPKIVCKGQDWVKCYLSECRVVPKILEKFEDIVCSYQDIFFKTDFKQTLGKKIAIYGAEVYHLMLSDHVYINCTGRSINKFVQSSWSGYATGFRPLDPPPTPPGREDTNNILLLGFDTTSKNGFIRRMPKSYKYLTEDLGAVILNGYNIVGDGTPAALFPILTGKTETELPDVRRASNKDTMNAFPFIFSKVRDDGYRTAFFEDTPAIGTFQYRFNGWRKQPTDHYIRTLLNEKESHGLVVNHCIGDTQSNKVMMNVTEQFMSLSGKKFIFTFIVEVSHNDVNKIQNADENLVSFLKNFKESNLRENTLLMVFGDHGPRYAHVRKVLQGKLEERLPLMAIHLPDNLMRQRSDAVSNLLSNVDVLTTPHDIHATILDVLEMRHHWNQYKVPGADLTRALTLLEPIPATRSCSEAGIEAHWCACLVWNNVTVNDPLYTRAGDKLVEFVNEQTRTLRHKCAVRNLKSIDWVIIHKVKDDVAKFISNKDIDGYTGRFFKTADIKETIQVKITVTPNDSMFEGSMSYWRSTDRLVVNPHEISRINEYGHEPDCISATHPHLNPYCYCND